MPMSYCLLGCHRTIRLRAKSIFTEYQNIADAETNHFKDYTGDQRRFAHSILHI